MHNLDLFYWKTAGHFTLKFGKALLRETFLLRTLHFYLVQIFIHDSHHSCSKVIVLDVLGVLLFLSINVVKCHKHFAVLFPSHKVGIKRVKAPTVFGCGECFAFVTYFTGKGSL